MKIGLVLSQTPTYSETFFRSKIEGLRSNGFEVTLFVQKRNEHNLSCRIVQAPRVFRNKMMQILQVIGVLIGLIPKTRAVLKFIALERQAKKSNIQILKNIVTNAHILTVKLDWLHFGFATLAIESEHVAKAINAKMAVSLRGFDICIYPLNHPKCYDKVWNNVDKIHAISNDLLKLAYANGLDKKVSSAVIHPAIDLNKFSQPQIKRNNEVLQITTVARLHWKKGIVQTLEALALLKKKGVDYKYTMIGTGPAHDELKFATYQLGIQDQVNFKGQIAHEEIRGILADTDIYLQYSVSEGFCNALIEAQAMGCLCVASDAEGITENILHGFSGFIVKRNEIELLSNKIIEILNMGMDRKSKFQEQAVSHVCKNFNIKDQIQDFLKFYEAY